MPTGPAHVVQRVIGQQAEGPAVRRLERKKDDLGINRSIDGVQLIDEGQTLGSVSVGTGTILISIDLSGSVGTNSLARSPHINMATLIAKGFTADDLDKIEEVLPGVFEIGFAFNQWTLGESVMQRLGFTQEQYNDPAFSMLKARLFVQKSTRRRWSGAAVILWGGPCSRPPASCRTRAMCSSMPSTAGATASIWWMRCTRKRCARSFAGRSCRR